MLLRPFYYDLVPQYCYCRAVSTIKQGNRTEHAIGNAVGKDDGRCITQGLHDVDSIPAGALRLFFLIIISPLRMEKDDTRCSNLRT